LDSIHFGLIVLDHEMRVVAWNRGCEDLWGLRSEEAMGELLGTLDIGLPTAELKPLIAGTFVDPSGIEETVVDATNRRGRDVRLRITCRAFGADREFRGALLLMEVQR
jgi:two-component system CheB/CheR fusion protein